MGSGQWAMGVADPEPAESAMMLQTTVLPMAMQHRVDGELRDGEELIWTAQPRAWLAARSFWFATLFGAAFAGFAVFWIFGAAGVSGGFSSANGSFSWFPLFGVPFVLVGLAIMLSPLLAARAARHTAYALTSERAIVFKASVFGSFSVQSFNADELGDMTRRERRDGSGDLVFKEIVTEGRDSDGHRTTSTTRYGFLAIDSVHEVEKLVRATLGV